MMGATTSIIRRDIVIVTNFRYRFRPDIVWRARVCQLTLSSNDLDATASFPQTGVYFYLPNGKLVWVPKPSDPGRVMAQRYLRRCGCSHWYAVLASALLHVLLKYYAVSGSNKLYFLSSIISNVKQIIV